MATAGQVKHPAFTSAAVPHIKKKAYSFDILNIFEANKHYSLNNSATE